MAKEPGTSAIGVLVFRRSPRRRTVQRNTVRGTRRLCRQMKIVGIGCKQILGVANKHEVFVLLKVAFFDEVFVDALSDVGGKAFGCFFGGRFCVAKLQATRGFLDVSSVERYDVKMHKDFIIECGLYCVPQVI
jgi:hypothetical protein